MAYRKYYIGALILVILSISLYVILPDKIRIDVESTRTRYSIFENGKFTLAATEYTYLYDGSKKMLANNRNVLWNNISGIIEITRLSTYKNNISVYEVYIFDSTKNDIELVPVSHTIRCDNCIGKILQFEYRDIIYEGETKDITSPFNFGKNMKLEWQEGSYYSKVFQQFTSDKIIIKYKPTKEVETYSVRLFDPPTVGTVLLNGVNSSRTYEYQTTVNISANVSTGTTYIDILDDTGRYINQSNQVNYTINLLRINKFSDGNTTKNISSGSDSTISIDNRTELDSAIFNITGINTGGGYPKNVEIGIN